MTHIGGLGVLQLSALSASAPPFKANIAIRKAIHQSVTNLATFCAFGQFYTQRDMKLALALAVAEARLHVTFDQPSNGRFYMEN